MVNDVSNWYVRRSRRRLWDESNSLDKVACQLTLHEVLTTVCRLVAPVSPFMVDEIHHNLTGSSVHTADWPTGVPGSLEGATADAWDESAAEATATLPPRDPVLESTMTLVRELAEAGRRIRIDAGRRDELHQAYKELLIKHHLPFSTLEAPTLAGRKAELLEILGISL